HAQLKNKLTPLENKIKQFFTKPSKENDKLMQYLTLHYQSKWMFDENDRFCFRFTKAEMPEDYVETLNDQMKQLAKDFSPVEVLRAELPFQSRALVEEA